jgi:hypothetical protein
MNMLKGWKTVLGILITAAVALGQATGVDPMAMPDWLEAIVAVFGTILAVYGRANATTGIFKGG